jgi:hypothetical protein
MEENGMREPLRKRKGRRRKCLHCRELFFADRRNRWHQRYCCKPQCRHSGKIAAQHRWLSSQKGRDYFQGPDNVRRVREWRAAHPGYWKRGRARSRDALQDVLSFQVIDKIEDVRRINPGALQDVCSLQPALLIGLIASLTGSTLQDDIAETSRRFIISGQDILGIDPSHKPKGGSHDGGKTHSLSGSSSPHTQTVQLGGSLSGTGQAHLRPES